MASDRRVRQARHTDKRTSLLTRDVLACLEPAIAGSSLSVRIIWALVTVAPGLLVSFILGAIKEVTGLGVQTDNAREVQVCSVLHRSGLRFQVTYPVPGLRRRTIDIACTRAKGAVFLGACFSRSYPELSSTWWTTKLAANQARDHDTSTSSRPRGGTWSDVGRNATRGCSPARRIPPLARNRPCNHELAERRKYGQADTRGVPLTGTRVTSRVDYGG